MNLTKIGLALVAAAFALFVYSGSTPQAFHSGGVAECSGCHSMHTPAPGGSRLLVGTDAGSTCLSCHESEGDTGPSSYHISTPEAELNASQAPKQRTPGGDFAWVKRAYSYSTTSNGVTTNFTEDGWKHGHNIVAVDKNYDPDPDNVTAPGSNGSFISENLSCSSCHDPHGRYRRLSNGTISTTGGAIKASGSYTNTTTNEPDGANAVGTYRLLAGANYIPVGGANAFPGVPAAKVPSTYNQSEATNQVRVAYGLSTTTGHTQWGTWCGTCHPNMHSQPNNYVHPVDQALSGVATTYSTYVGSGIVGPASTSYLSLVPFVENQGNYATLASHAKNDNTYLNGPAAQDQVSCLSCHRAHASGMLHGLRFDMEYEFMTKGGQYIGSDNPLVGTTGRGPLQSRGRTNAEWQAAYYDRLPTQFATYQRVLCNKCHAQD